MDATPGTALTVQKALLLVPMGEKQRMCFSPHLAFGVVSLILFPFTVDV